MTTVINIRDKKALNAAVRSGLFVSVGREPGRLGPWGNRYSHLASKVPGVIRVETREEAVRQHRKEMLDDVEKIREIRRVLKGKVLGCWCHPEACHAHTLAAIADGRLGGV